MLNTGAVKSTSDQKTPVLYKLMSVVLIALVLAIFSGSYVLLNKFFNRPVDSVTMQGQYQFIDKNSIKNIIEPYVGAGFFNIDLNQVKQDIENHPWVYSADVMRVWPNEIAINLIEHKPIVRWQKNGYLNAQGQPFFPEAESVLDELVKLSAPDGHHEKVLAAYQWLVPRLSEYGFGISTLTLDAKGAMTLTLSNNLLLKFGVEEYEEKLKRFLLAYESKLKSEQEKIKYVDLRYTNGLAVGWLNN